MHIYQVGGAVRDRLLGLTPRETDWLVAGASVDDMLAQGFRPIDPAIPVFLHPDTGDEYALARRETKRGQGHKGFTFEFGPDVTVEEDLRRRDLTVNAMAEDEDGHIVDPFGGRDDLMARRLRHVSPAFPEDPLRVLRLARFAAQLSPFNFTVDDATARLAKAMSADTELLSLTPARCWRELAKALDSPRPGRYLDHLSGFGALHRLMPWLATGSVHAAGTPSPSDALDAAAALSGSPGVRLAAACLAASLAGATGLPPDDWPLPKDMRDLVQVCQRNPLPGSAQPERILAWLESMDAWRRHDRLQASLLARQAVQPHAADEFAMLADAAATTRGARPPAGSTNPREDVRRVRIAAIAALSGPGAHSP